MHVYNMCVCGHILEMCMYEFIYLFLGVCVCACVCVCRVGGGLGGWVGG